MMLSFTEQIFIHSSGAYCLVPHLFQDSYHNAHSLSPSLNTVNVAAWTHLFLEKIPKTSLSYERSQAHEVALTLKVLWHLGFEIFTSFSVFSYDPKCLMPFDQSFDRIFLLIFCILIVEFIWRTMGEAGPSIAKDVTEVSSYFFFFSFIFFHNIYWISDVLYMWRVIFFLEWNFWVFSCLECLVDWEYTVGVSKQYCDWLPS